jgi:inosine-uridine nucleoside N-ribohydrolase
MFGDPDAADRIFTCGADVLAVGINVTNQVILSGKSLMHLQLTSVHDVCCTELLRLRDLIRSYNIP